MDGISYPGISTFHTNVLLLEETESVLGGSAGPDNRTAIELADRTTYLNAQDFDYLQQSVEGMSNGKMTVRADDNGVIDFFYVLKKFKPDWLTGESTWDAGDYHKAFYVDGDLKDEILVSVVPAVADTIASVATVRQARMEEPSNLSISDLRTKIATKGTGYHLMTCFEYGALILEGLTGRSSIPGNTDDGKEYDASPDVNDQKFGIPIDLTSHYYTYPGSGPLSWNHNNSPWGVADLVGNYYEWLEGLYLDETELVMMGTDNHYDNAEGSWVNTGIFFDDDGSGNMELDTVGATSLTLSDAMTDITLSTALLAAGNSYAGAVLVDALIATVYEDSGSEIAPTILSAIKGNVQLAITTASKTYFIAGADYDTGLSGGSGTRANTADAAGSPSPASLIGRYVLIE